MEGDNYSMEKGLLLVNKEEKRGSLEIMIILFFIFIIFIIVFVFYSFGIVVCFYFFLYI